MLGVTQILVDDGQGQGELIPNEVTTRAGTMASLHRLDNNSDDNNEQVQRQQAVEEWRQGVNQQLMLRLQQQQGQQPQQQNSGPAVITAPCLQQQKCPPLSEQAPPMKKAAPHPLTQPPSLVKQLPLLPQTQQQWCSNLAGPPIQQHTTPLQHFNAFTQPHPPLATPAQHYQQAVSQPTPIFKQPLHQCAAPQPMPSFKQPPPPHQQTAPQPTPALNQPMPAFKQPPLQQAAPTPKPLCKPPPVGFKQPPSVPCQRYCGIAPTGASVVYGPPASTSSVTSQVPQASLWSEPHREEPLSTETSSASCMESHGQRPTPQA